jgi:hypothetical protein
MKRYIVQILGVTNDAGLMEVGGCMELDNIIEVKNVLDIGKAVAALFPEGDYAGPAEPFNTEVSCPRAGLHIVTLSCRLSEVVIVCSVEEARS